MSPHPTEVAEFLRCLESVMGCMRAETLMLDLRKMELT